VGSLRGVCPQSSASSLVEIVRDDADAATAGKAIPNRLVVHAAECAAGRSIIY
jgi:hypothetical protein